MGTLHVHEVGEFLGVADSTVRRYADAGRLRCHRLPTGHRRFELADVLAFSRALRSRRGAD